METVSDYPLSENMTFEVDTFLHDPDFGLRWENGARITADAPEMMSGKFRKVIELDV